MRKPTFWFPTWSDINQAVQLQKMARGLNFGFRKSRECTIYVAKTKALISFAVTAKLICVFVFAYAKRWFSIGAAHICFASMYFQDMQVNCLAVINDTVGALMSCAHQDRECAIGLILGKFTEGGGRWVTGFWGFRPGATQTGLCSLRRWLEL